MIDMGKKNESPGFNNRICFNCRFIHPYRMLDRDKVVLKESAKRKMDSKKNIELGGDIYYKELQKELDDLIEEYIKMELRPCRGDADLHQREKDLEMLRQNIRIAEREIDRHLYTV